MVAFAVGSPVSHREVTEFVACITLGSEAVSGHQALLYSPLNVIKKKKKKSNGEMGRVKILKH